MAKKIMKKNIAKHWIPVTEGIPDFENEAALYMNVAATGPNMPSSDHYDYGKLKSVTMTSKGKEVIFLNREGKEVKASHWFYMAPPTKD